MIKPAAPTWDETYQRASFHLQEAERSLSARWPRRLDTDRPSLFQNKAMRKAVKQIRKARARLDAANTMPANETNQ